MQNNLKNIILFKSQNKVTVHAIMRLSRDVRKPCLRRRQKASTIAERTEKGDLL
jgi:hypothetical protein